MKKYSVSIYFALLVIIPQFAYSSFSLFDRRAAINQSYIHESKLDYDRAIETLMPLYKLDSNSYFMNLRLGWLFYLKGPLKNAEFHYQRAIEIKPSSLEARLGLYKVFTAKFQHDLALQTAKSIITLDSHHYTGHLQAASSAMMLNDYTTALTYIESIRKHYPIDQGLLEQRCLILSKMPEMKAAFQESFRELITIYPQSPMIIQKLVQLDLEQSSTK